MSKLIKNIYGPEPRRDGECPDGYHVGYGGITKIEETQENLGTYGIIWFEVYAGETMIAKMNAAHVASVMYFKGDEK